MGGIFAKAAPAQAAVTPDYTGLQIQTAVNTLPMPIVWGMSKIAPNVIWYNAFQSHAVAAGGGGGGGKGGFFNSNNNGQVQYTYTASVIMALCEGPITGIAQIWRGQSIYTLSSLGLSLALGTTPQAVWSYLTANYPSQALAYQGTSYVFAANYNLTDSATLDNHNFEVQGQRYHSGFGPLGSMPDADPSQCVLDFLTNAQFGVGFPSGSYDPSTLSGTASSYQTYCQAAGLALSPALTDQEQASSILSRWLQLTNTAAVWSNGWLRFIPYGDLPIIGNGTTFTPNVTPVYDLSDDDYITEANADPLQVTRSDPYAAYNVWRLEVADRSNAYNLTTVESRDQNAIELYGMRIAPTVTAHEICDTGIGLISGQLGLQRSVYIRNTYKFRLSWEYCLLDPMDLVTVTDAILGLSKQAIRITEIEEDDNGYLEVTAEEFPLGVATATLYDTVSSGGTAANRNVVPASVNPPIFYTPPATVNSSVQNNTNPAGATVSNTYVWIALSGGTTLIADPNWGGAVVNVSLDNRTFAVVGTIRGPAKMGVLTGNMSTSVMSPDTTDTLAVDLTESAGVIPPSISTTDAQVGANTLCLVDSELMSYKTATLTATSKFSCTSLFRGLYGTSQVSHSTNAPFALMDSAIFRYQLPAQYVGQTLIFKFQSYNAYGGGLQSLSSCVDYTYSPPGVPTDHPVARELMIDGSTIDLGLAHNAVGPTTDDFGANVTMTIELYVDLNG